jgi:RHS repeat-associated protein
VYDNGQVVLQFEKTGTGSLAAGDLSNRYLWGPAVDQLFADEQDGEVLWALTDQLGTVRDLIDNSGTLQNHKSYDAFGNVISETNGAVDTLFGFTGKLFDDATGLQNNLNRWYDPAVGRWLSEDPIGFAAGDANLYSYVQNEPTSSIDPSGLVGGAWPGQPNPWTPPSAPPYQPKPGSWLWDYEHYVNPFIDHHAVNRTDACLQWGTRVGQGMAVIFSVSAAGVSVAGVGGVAIGGSTAAAGGSASAGGGAAATAGVTAAELLTPKGAAAAFGWGIGARAAAQRTASITLSEVQAAGITVSAAQHWLNVYRDAIVRGAGGQTAIERAKLMEKIIGLLN